MKKGREIISLPVISHTDGNQIGEIKDIYYNPTAKKIIGFVMEEKGWLKGAKILPMEAIAEINNEAVIVGNQGQLIDTSKDEDICAAFDNRIDIRGSRLINDLGEELGIIGDLLVKTDDGEIYGYELSDGIIHDLLQGRKSVIIPGHIVVENGQVKVFGLMKGDLQ